MRFIRAAGLLTAFVLSVALLAASDTRAQGFTLAGVWNGYYYYNDGRTKVDFVLDLKVENGRCVGRTSERNTFGDKSAAELFGNVTCQMAGVGPGRVLRFHKQYDGTGGVSHGVEYSGVLSEDGNTVTGQWTIKKTTGQFSMTRNR